MEELLKFLFTSVPLWLTIPAGLIAEGGGDFTVDTESAVDFTVLSVLDSVTIVCALLLNDKTISKIIKMFFNSSSCVETTYFSEFAFITANF